ncbi:MAG: 3'-5' exonuclease [Paludibacteraceae bacterium]|nr:3'-5' exonuclease [Paludibacteraceae bacterium]MBP6284066.1 3'-5' exonuclease [Paludibacteraceae bacterium]
MNNTPLDKILFLDIETVPQQFSLTELPESLHNLWSEKIDSLKRRMPDRYLDEEGDEEATFRREAGIYAEFGKIVCISVGFIHMKDGVKYCRIKSFYGSDEKALLTEFSTMLTRFMHTFDHQLCGHNIKEFDVPYIARRMLINGLPLPKAIQVAGKKPWEVKFIDTLELWRFGDYKNYTSLKLLTAIFDIPTPKDDIDGSQVASVYYEENDIERIATYCQKDVVATAQLYLKFCGETMISSEHIEYV